MSGSLSAAGTGGDGLPRPLLWAGVPLAAVLLIGLFVFLGFPYDRVRDALATQLGAATGARVRIAGLGPGLSPLGPVLVARGVEADLPDGSTLALERARLRPAWSLAWLRGEAALAVDLAAPEGRVQGTLYAGGEPGFDGRVEEVDLARLPADRLLPDLALDGTASADVDLRGGDAGPRGRVDLDARKGALGIPGVPMAVPYEHLQGEVDLEEEGGIRVRNLTLDGPLLAVSGNGSVGDLDDPAARLDLQMRVEVREESVRPMVERLGLRLGPDGAGDVRIGGTLRRPTVRSAP